MSTKRFDPFYVRFYALVGGLLAACLLLVGLTWIQGPRIRQATVDTKNVTTQSNQRLIIRTNEPLGSLTKDQISVSPATPIKTTASGNTVIVQFEQRLRYKTTYTVTIKDGKHTLRHSFRTPNPTIYYMEPSVAGTSDVIRVREVGSLKESVVYQAEEIIDFAVLDDALVIVTRNPDYTNNLIHLSLDSKEETLVTLPEPGTVAHLQSAPDKKTFGYSFTSKIYKEELNSALYMASVSNLKPKPVTGLSGKLVQVIDWVFAPDSATILAQLSDTTTFITTASSNKKPTPLGQFTGIGGFTTDGKVILQDRDGPLLLDLASTKQERLAPTEIGSDSFTTSTLPFHNSKDQLLIGQAFTGTHYLDYVVAAYGTTRKALHETSKSEGILSTELSPNDQYASIIVSEPHEGNLILEARIIDLITGDISTIDEAAKAHW